MNSYREHWPAHDGLKSVIRKTTHLVDTVTIGLVVVGGLLVLTQLNVPVLNNGVTKGRQLISTAISPFPKVSEATAIVGEAVKKFVTVYFNGVSNDRLLLISESSLGLGTSLKSYGTDLSGRHYRRIGPVSVAHNLS